MPHVRLQLAKERALFIDRGTNVEIPILRCAIHVVDCRLEDLVALVEASRSNEFVCPVQQQPTRSLVHLHEVGSDGICDDLLETLSLLFGESIAANPEVSDQGLLVPLTRHSHPHGPTSCRLGPGKRKPDVRSQAWLRAFETSSFENS